MNKIICSSGSRFGGKDCTFENAKEEYIDFHVERKFVPHKIREAQEEGETYDQIELHNLFEELKEEIESRISDNFEEEDDSDYQGIKMSSQEAWDLRGGGR